MHVLRSLWAAWRRFGRIIGDFIGRIVLMVFYFTIFVPFALITRLLLDPLKTRRMPGETQWVAREPQHPSLEDLRQQF